MTIVYSEDTPGHSIVSFDCEGQEYVYDPTENTLQQFNWSTLIVDSELPGAGYFVTMDDICYVNESKLFMLQAACPKLRFDVNDDDYISPSFSWRGGKVKDDV